MYVHTYTYIHTYIHACTSYTCGAHKYINILYYTSQIHVAVGLEYKLHSHYNNHHNHYLHSCLNCQLSLTQISEVNRKELTYTCLPPTSLFLSHTHRHTDTDIQTHRQTQTDIDTLSPTHPLSL